MPRLAVLTILLGLATGAAFAQSPKAKSAPPPAAALPPIPVPTVVDTGAVKREAAGYFAQGYDAWKAGNLDIARELFDRGLALDPVNADALFYAGEVARAKRDFAVAEGYYKRSLAANPDGRNAIPAQGALASLGEQTKAMETFAAAFDAEKAGNLAEAKRLYTEGLKRNDDPQARARLEKLRAAELEVAAQRILQIASPNRQQLQIAADFVRTQPAWAWREITDPLLGQTKSQSIRYRIAVPGGEDSIVAMERRTTNLGAGSVLEELSHTPPDWNCKLFDCAKPDRSILVMNGIAEFPIEALVPSSFRQRITKLDGRLFPLQSDSTMRYETSTESQRNSSVMPTNRLLKFVALRPHFSNTAWSMS